MKTYLELETHDDLRLEPQLSLLVLVLLLSSLPLLLLYCHVTHVVVTHRDRGWWWCWTCRMP
jgi:hypothetical protein